MLIRDEGTPGDECERELTFGLIRIHVLLHATEGTIFGLATIREHEEHGYPIAPGRLYPLLHGFRTKRAGALDRDYLQRDLRASALTRVKS